jgi:hypothetical protein
MMSRNADSNLDSVSKIVLHDVGSIDLTITSHAAGESAGYELEGAPVRLEASGETVTLRGDRGGAAPQAVAIEGSYVTGNVSISSPVPSSSPLRVRASRRGEAPAVVRLYLSPGRKIVVSGYGRTITTTTPDGSAAATNTRNVVEAAAEAIRERADSIRSRLLGGEE